MPSGGAGGDGSHEQFKECYRHCVSMSPGLWRRRGDAHAGKLCVRLKGLSGNSGPKPEEGGSWGHPKSSLQQCLPEASSGQDVEDLWKAPVVPEREGSMEASKRPTGACLETPDTPLQRFPRETVLQKTRFQGLQVCF